MNLKKIEKSAREFRDGIKNTETSLLPFTMSNFPKGSCGDASLLLGTYFIEKGFGKFFYICKAFSNDCRHNWHSHAWLQKGKLFIDITADQFPEVKQEVLVTYDSKWHLKFNEPVLKGVADYKIYDENTKAILGAAYREILRNIKTS